MKPYRRYSLLVAAFLLGQSIIVTLFNLAIDPYTTFNSPAILGFNKVKPKQDKQVRMYKAIAITRLQPKIVFIGSSRTEFGLDPSHPVFEGDRPYNLAVTGANIYEAKRYLDHAIANQPNLKKAIVGLDFFMFNDRGKNAPDFRESRLGVDRFTIPDKINSLFSIDAFIASLITIQSNLKETNAPGYFYSDGRRVPGYYRKHVYLNQHNRWIFKASLRRNRFLIGGDKPEERSNISEKYLNSLKAIVEICQTQKIDCQFFISPSHVSQWEFIRLSGVWPLFEQWKREIVEITPVWDFSGYNSITTEPIGRRMKYYLDNSHYLKPVGDLLLNRIFQYREESVPGDFGVKIDTDNIESHLEKIRSDREVWSLNNPDEVKWVQRVKQK
ncbi:MAG: hypothetical protein F6J93_10605 [Oscillatoria sp. SIO1A7]|nr:hypothetical protein [Oscillatoria sp. SIO1A7]